MKKGKILSTLLLSAALFLGATKAVNADALGGNLSYNKVPGVTNLNNVEFQQTSVPNTWNGISYNTLWGLAFGRQNGSTAYRWNWNLGTDNTLPFPFDHREARKSDGQYLAQSVFAFTLSSRNSALTNYALAYTAGYCVGWGVPFAEYKEDNLALLQANIIDYHNAKRTRNGDMVNDDQYNQLRYVMTYAYNYPVVPANQISDSVVSAKKYGSGIWGAMHYYDYELVDNVKSQATQYLMWVTVNGYLNDEPNRTRIEKYFFEDSSYNNKWSLNHNVTRDGVDQQYYAYRDQVISAMRMPSFTTNDINLAKQNAIELQWNPINNRFEKTVEDANGLSKIAKISMNYAGGNFHFENNGDGSVTMWTDTPMGTKEDPVVCTAQKTVNDAKEVQIFSQGANNQPIAVPGKTTTIVETSSFAVYTQAFNIQVVKTVEPIEGNIGDAKAEGCEYTIFKSEDCAPDQAVETLRIGADGKTPLSKYLPYQVYFVKETKVNDSTLPNETVYKVNPADAKFVDGKLVVELGTSNKIVYGALDVVKYRDDPNTTVDMTGYQATLKLVLKSASKEMLAAGKEVYTGKVTETGKLRFENLPYGIYELVEQDTATNRFLEINAEDVNIDVHGEEEYRIVSDDKFSAFIAIYKQDKRTGAIVKLPGAKFKIWNTETHKFESFQIYNPSIVVDELETDANGKAMTPEALYSGEYRIFETQAPEGYYLNDDLALPEQGKMTNAQYAALLDTKGMALSVNKEIDTQKKDVGNGVYIETFEINCKDDLLYIDLELYKTGEVFSRLTQKTTKYGEMYSPIYEEKGLKGVTFDIYAEENIMSPDGQVKIIDKGTKVGTATTNDEGTATFKELIPGTYKLVETVTPEGYIKSEDQVIKLERKEKTERIEIQNKDIGNKKQKLIVKAKKLFSVSEYKMNMERKAVFGVFANADIYNYNKSIKIPKDGLVELIEFEDSNQTSPDVDLPAGTYYVQEIFTTSPYELTGEKKEVELKAGANKAEVVEVDAGTFINTFTTKDIKLVKFSATSIYAANQMGLTGLKINEEEVDQKLQAFVKELKELNADQIKDVIEESAYMTVAGAEYGLFWDAECKIPVLYESNDEPVVVTTAPDSCFYEINDLPIGQYFIKELKAPVYTDGEYEVPYKLNEKAVQLDVTDDAEVGANIVIRPLWDAMVDGPGIDKTDIFTGDGIPDCVFEISDEKGNVLLHSTTFPDCTAFIPTDILENGKKYYYTELSAPEIYELDTTPHEFTAKFEAGFDEDGNYYYNWLAEHLEVTNVRKTIKKLTVKKVDEETGKPLAGCVFSIALLDDKGNVYVNEKGEEIYLVKDGVTDENGEYVVENPYFGTYKFTEITPPEGYELKEDDMLGYVFTIDKNSPEEIVFEVTNTGDIAVYAISALALASVLGIAFVVTKKVKASKV